MQVRLSLALSFKKLRMHKAGEGELIALEMSIMRGFINSDVAYEIMVLQDLSNNFLSIYKTRSPLLGVCNPIISQCNDIFTDQSIFRYFSREIGQF